jgi:hypothetical protein
VNLLHGGFPEVLSRPKARSLWFASYLQTYLERDVRAITDVRDLVTFRRFLSLLASRHGQVLDKTDLAAHLGVSVPTIGEWLSILEVTGQIVKKDEKQKEKRCVVQFFSSLLRDNYRERECPFASRFGLCVTDALGMKTSAGSLNRVLNFRTCSKVRLRCPVMNIETALSEPN